MTVDTEAKFVTKQKRKRTKTGCKTCRIRRVKCDEVRPSCHKCTSTGRKCDGYPRPWPKFESAPAILLVAVTNEPAHTGFDVRARSAFQFFYEVCAPSLVNYGSHYFWNKLVLQACHADESIKHLVIAASALDRHARFNGCPNQASDESSCFNQASNNALFLSHYGKACKLVAASPNPRIEIVLMACLLFIICDEFQRNRFGALQHVIAGRRIISNYFSRRKDSIYDTTINELCPIFEQLHLHTGELDQETMPQFIRWPFENHRPAPSPPDYSFRHGVQRNDSSALVSHDHLTMETAGAYLQALVPFCSSKQPSIVPPYSVFHTVPNVTQQLNQWLTRFDVLCKQMDHDEASDRRTDIHLLRTYQQCLSIMSRCAPFKYEQLYDKYGAQFEHLCVKFAHIQANNSKEHVGHQLLSPTFFVASHYRDVAFRRQAINNLKRCGWAGVRLATIAEQAVEIEEGDLVDAVVCDDIPGNRRIRVDGVEFARSKDTGKTVGILSFHRYPFSHLPGVAHQHRFDWPDVEDTAVQDSVKQLLRRALKFEFC